MGQLLTCRVYDARNSASGIAGASGTPALFLVDRLWPRGVKKSDLDLAGWPKELTPSPELRRAFHSGAVTWEQFGDAYRGELDERDAGGELDDALAAIRGKLAEGDVVLLFAGKDTEHSHATVLRDWLTDSLVD